MTRTRGTRANECANLPGTNHGWIVELAFLLSLEARSRAWTLSAG